MAAAAQTGRNIRIARHDGSSLVTVVGARTDSISITNEGIDITDKDDSGWRILLAEVGGRSVTCDVEGVLKDSKIIDDSVEGGSVLLSAVEVRITGMGTTSNDITFTGNVYLNNFSAGGEQGEAITFTATLESAGTIAFTDNVAP